ncbi:hypothetical protein MAR_022006 [Mya arenaria]|uniref:Uncharacterized protein n=1 Tax=Mya arenaria TaxID=6604 RepID=A0ABY7E9D7_MYAAR|nr:hypothetical protein MAR_022006 [Mya arenaria]
MVTIKLSVYHVMNRSTWTHLMSSWQLKK